MRHCANKVKQCEQTRHKMRRLSVGVRAAAAGSAVHVQDKGWVGHTITPSNFEGIAQVSQTSFFQGYATRRGLLIFPRATALRARAPPCRPKATGLEKSAPPLLVAKAAARGAAGISRGRSRRWLKGRGPTRLVGGPGCCGAARPKAGTPLRFTTKPSEIPALVKVTLWRSVRCVCQAQD